MTLIPNAKLEPILQENNPEQKIAVKLESHSATLTEALFLYEKGFNIFPVEYGKKEAYKKWGVLKSCRFPLNRIPELFEDKNNIAVITGKLSKNLVVIDCDDPNVFRNYLSIFESLKLATWVVATTRGGHIWLLSEDGEIQNYEGEGFEIWGNNHYVIAPPSLNQESGVIYSWIKRDGNLPSKVDFFTLKSLFPKLKISRQLNGILPSVVCQVLIHKNIVGYKTNSEAEYAVALSLIRCGWDDDSILELFQYFKPSHFLERNLSREWLIENTIKPARKVIPVPCFTDKIINSVFWAVKYGWSPRTGLNDKAVFLACCKRAMLEGPNDFRATEREIAELAYVTDQTANIALGRLRKYGFIEIVTKNQEGEPYRKGSGNHFRINPELQNQPNNDTVITFIEMMSSTLELQNHDVWHPKALGKTSYSVYNYLLSKKGETIKGISKGIQKSENATKFAIGKLSNYLLICQEEDNWIAIPRSKRFLDAIARILGTLGIAERRKQQHLRDRENKAFAMFTKE